MDAESHESRRQTCHVSANTSGQLLVRSQAVVSRCVGGETLIVPVRGKVGDLASIYSFNETGSLIWKHLQSPTTLLDLVSAMTREFEVTEQQAESDALRFVSDMLAAGLVEVSNAVGGAESQWGGKGWQRRT